MNMDKKQKRYIERIVMAGLRMIGENDEGEPLETFGDLFKEHDAVMALLGLDEESNLVFGEEAILKDPQ